jgi:hypothetical protein
MSNPGNFPFRKLPSRYAAVIMPLLLSVLMTFVVSAISTLRILGPGMAFLRAWPFSWAMSWTIAFPTLLAVLPMVRRLTAALVQPPQAAGSNG